MALVATGLATHIANNQLRSVLLLAGFPLLLSFLLFAFSAGLEAMAQSSAGLVVDWRAAAVGGWETLGRYGHWAVIAAAAWFAIAYFFHGSMIRAATSAHPVTRQEMPRIYNLLENLCIAQGMPMPAFDIIETPALNAFASGINDKTYRITLTRGLVEALADDELEAVIAHELAHIRHKDVRLLIVSVVFVGMIGFLAEMAFRGLVYGGGRSRAVSRDGRQPGGQAAVMILAVVILAVGYVFAVLIRFALSRRREYLADAGAVDMTKNPEAMMRALLRISGKDRVPGMPDDVQMMCIENSHAFLGLFATHPPIEKRVEIISRMTDTPVPQSLSAAAGAGFRVPRGGGA